MRSVDPERRDALLATADEDRAPVRSAAAVVLEVIGGDDLGDADAGLRLPLALDHVSARPHPPQKRARLLADVVDARRLRAERGHEMSAGREQPQRTLEVE